jgi:hypothetical protein
VLFGCSVSAIQADVKVVRAAAPTTEAGTRFALKPILGALRLAR